MQGNKLKQPKNKFTLIIVVLALVLVVSGILFAVSAIKKQREPREEDFAALQQVLEDSGPLLTDEYKFVPIVSVEILGLPRLSSQSDTRLGTQSGTRSDDTQSGTQNGTQNDTQAATRQAVGDIYQLRAEVTRKDELVQVTGDFNYEVSWDGKARLWQIEEATPADTELHVEPLQRVTTREISRALEGLTLTSSAGNLWTITEADLATLIISERDFTGLQETITTALTLTSDYKQVEARIKLHYEWEVEGWSLAKAAPTILQAEEQVKQGTIFSFTEKTVEHLWSGQTLTLAETEQGTTVLTLPEVGSAGEPSGPAGEPSREPETNSRNLSNIVITEVVAGPEEGTYSVSYHFDAGRGDWFAVRWYCEETFVLDLATNTYFRQDDTAQYRWEPVKADLTGTWYGVYQASGGTALQVKLDLVEAANEAGVANEAGTANEAGFANAYGGTLTFVSEIDPATRGSYQITCELDPLTFAFNLNYGEWLEEVADLSRFGFQASLIPDDGLLQSDDDLLHVKLGRQESLAPLLLDGAEDVETTTIVSETSA